MLSVIRKRPIVSFSVLAFFFTYVVGLPWALTTQELERALGLKEELLSLAFMRGGPTIAALIVVAVLAGGGGLLTWLKHLVRWRTHPGYYVGIVALVTLPFVATVFAIIPWAQVIASPDLAASRDWPAIAGAYLGEAAYRIATNGEETGWRFAMLSLLLARMRMFPAVLIVALVWAVWHMPAFFLFGQAPLWYPLVLICLSWSVLLGWLYVRSGSLLLCLIAHGAANATFYTFEAQLPDLSARWDALEPLGDWVFSSIAIGVALVVLLLERRMFFAPTPANPGQDWIAPAVVARTEAQAPGKAVLE
jgi:uncharacterized protein